MSRYLLPVLAIALCLAGVPFVAQAQGGFIQNVQKGVDAASKPAGFSSQPLEQIIGNVIAVVLSLAGIALLLILLYAGFLWMTSQGNGEQVEKATNMIRNAIIGLVIVSSAYAITSFVLGRLAGAGGGQTAVSVEEASNIHAP
ncbi:MAG: Type secretion system pilin [Candidatus Parcubacteria bacterium]|jgi:cytochrome bd-type quinol oxidase subunit 2